MQLKEVWEVRLDYHDRWSGVETERIYFDNQKEAEAIEQKHIMEEPMVGERTPDFYTKVYVRRLV